MSIVIPHLSGAAILLACLSALQAGATPEIPQEILLVDNASTDGSVAAAQAEFPTIRVVTSTVNHGYAGGCNLGLAAAHGRYVVFLNNDTEVTPGWLRPLVAALEADLEIAAAQPKLLSLQAHRRGERVFDYAGGAGGLLDRLGYPFALGRVGAAMEPDRGQYDTAREIFWASGAAMFARTDAVRAVGGFDADFFAHMEEIDLAWRLHLAGYRIVSVPTSVVYHLGGATLAAGHPRKGYLNHRNSVAMLVKNASALALLRDLPLRLGLELAAVGYYPLRRGWAWVAVVPRSLGWLIGHGAPLWRKRRAVQRLRRAPKGAVEQRLAPAFTGIRQMFG